MTNVTGERDQVSNSQIDQEEVSIFLEVRKKFVHPSV